MPAKKPRVETRELEPKKDMFYVYNADPDKVYRHAADDPLRIRELQLKGFKVCDGNEVHLVDPMVLQDSADSMPINLPGLILMETSKENAQRLQSIKDAKFSQHERDVKDRIDEVQALVERKGLGGKLRARLQSEEIEL